MIWISPSQLYSVIADNDFVRFRVAIASFHQQFQGLQPQNLTLTLTLTVSVSDVSSTQTLKYKYEYKYLVFTASTSQVHVRKCWGKHMIFISWPDCMLKLHNCINNNGHCFYTKLKAQVSISQSRVHCLVAATTLINYTSKKQGATRVHTSCVPCVAA